MDVLEIWDQPLAIIIPILLFLPGLSGAGVAQLVEHLICNQRIGGSIPSASSTRKFCGGREAERSLQSKMNGLVSLDTSPFCVFARGACKLLKDLSAGLVVRVPKCLSGRVGGWLKPADCKSAAPCGLRRFESFPVHQALVVGLQKTAGQSQERCSKAVQFGAQAPLRKSAPRGTIFERETGWAWVAQLVERVLGKDEVTGSSPVQASRILAARRWEGRKVQIGLGRGHLQKSWDSHGPWL